MKKNMWCDCICSNKNKVFFTGVFNAAIYSLDIQSKEYELLKFLPDKKYNSLRCNPCIICNKNKIYLFPDLSHVIYIYDLDSGEIKKIKIENGEKVRLSIYIATLIDDSIFFVSEGTRKIYKLDISNYLVTEVYDLADTIGDDSRIARDYCKVDNTICFPIPNKSIICKFSVDDYSLKMIHLSDTFFPYALEYDRGIMYVSGQKNEILEIDYNIDEIINEIELPSDIHIFSNVGGELQKTLICQSNAQAPIFKEIHKKGNKLLFVPYYCDSLILFDLKEKRLEVLQIDEKVCMSNLRKNERITYRGGCDISEFNYVIYSSLYDKYININFDTKKIETFDITLKYDNKLITELMQREKKIVENTIDLENFIQYIVE